MNVHTISGFICGNQFTEQLQSRGSSVSWVICYRLKNLTIGVWFLAGAGLLFPLPRPNRPWGPPKPPSNEYGEKGSRNLKLTSDLHLVQRSQFVELYLPDTLSCRCLFISVLSSCDKSTFLELSFLFIPSLMCRKNLQELWPFQKSMGHDLLPTNYLGQQFTYV
jgi:hypothetical protein